MRKFALAIFLLCSAAAAVFAGGNLEITGGYPIQGMVSEGYLSGTNIPTKIEMFLSGPSVGINYASFKGNSKIAPGIFLNVQFPIFTEVEIKTDYGNTSGDGKIKDGFDSYVSVDALFGPVFKVISTKAIEIPLSIGVHMRYDRYEVKGYSSNSDIYFGAGANAGINIFVSQAIYIAAKCQASYDFLILSDDDTLKSAVSVIPTLGLGFKL